MSGDAHTPTEGRPGPAPGGSDFRRLRETGERSGVSLAIGGRICAARDVVARGFIRVGFTPNRMTVLGLLLTCGAGFCLAWGALDQVPYFYNGGGPKSWWPVGAALFLFLAGASDMLDGAIARVGNMQTRFGAILDSSLDRFGDMALFLGCAVCFALAENLTLVVLAIVALGNAMSISYIKARAEEVIDDCSVGFWLRGERIAAVLIGCITGHMVAVIWQLALSSTLTVWRRLDFARRTVSAQDAGGPPPPRGPAPGVWGRVQLWRHPRGSWPYDLVVGANIAYIVVAPWLWPMLTGEGPAGDPLRLWLGR